MSRFRFVAFDGAVPVQELSGTRGDFYNPNQLVIKERVEGKSLSDGKLTTFEAKGGRAVFKATGIFAIMKEPRLEEVFLGKSVRVFSEGFRLASDYVTLWPDRQIAGKMPTRVSRGKSWLLGQKGFVYHLDSGQLFLNGKIEGEFYPGQTSSH